MKRILQVLAGFAISAGALWLTLRGRDLGAIWGATKAADYRYLAPYVLLLIAIHFIRTVRWGILLEPVAKVPFARLNSVSAVGIMALVLLPFRLGEFARPYLIADRPRLRVSAALSSVVVERVTDGLFTGLLLVVSLLAVPAGTPGLAIIRPAGIIVFVAFSGLLVFLVVAHRNRALAVRAAHRIIDPFSARLADRVSGMMDAFIHGLRLVPSGRKVAAFFALTAIYWALNGIGIQLLAKGFGIFLTSLQSYTVLGVLVVGVMIPAGPGMIGTFQAALVLGLTLYLPKAVVDTQGNAFANVIWATQVAQQTLFGLIFLFSKHIRFDQLFRASGEVEEGLEREEKEYQAAGDGADVSSEDAPVSVPHGR